MAQRINKRPYSFHAHDRAVLCGTQPYVECDDPGGERRLAGITERPNLEDQTVFPIGGHTKW